MERDMKLAHCLGVVMAYQGVNYRMSTDMFNSGKNSDKECGIIDNDRHLVTSQVPVVIICDL
jgi:hypothetical protein